MSHVRRSCPFEAFIWNDVHINHNGGKVQIIRGLYRVRIMSDEHGKRFGAYLASMDMPGEPTIGLTQAQYELLDRTRYSRDDEVGDLRSVASTYADRQ